MPKNPLPDIGGKQVNETKTTREYAVKDLRVILNWEEQTTTIIRPLAGEQITLPIFLVAFILQRFGGFRIELNAEDWTGPKGVWAKAAEASKAADSVTDGPGGPDAPASSPLARGW